MRANYFQAGVQRGWLTCKFLNFGLISNRVESIAAKRTVEITQAWTGTNDQRAIEKKLNCESLMIYFCTNGLVQSILAERDVHAQQSEVRPGRPQPLRSELTAGTATFSFYAHTNQVREIMAEHNVSIVQDTKKARGEKAVYTASNTQVELTGNPTAELPIGRITRAQALIWDQAHHTLTARAKGANVIGEGEVPNRATNRISPLFPKSK